MTGKFIAYTLSVFAFFYIMLISISLFFHLSINEKINDICYDAAETISTKAVLSDEIYRYVKSNIDFYGEYALSFTLKRDNKDGTSTYYYGEDQIKNIALNRGDRLSVSVEGLSPSLFEKVTGTRLRVSVVKFAVIN